MIITMGDVYREGDRAEFGRTQGAKNRIKKAFSSSLGKHVYKGIGIGGALGALSGATIGSARGNRLNNQAGAEIHETGKNARVLNAIVGGLGGAQLGGLAGVTTYGAKKFVRKVRGGN